MTKGKTGNSKFLKAYNETYILNLIRVNKSLSRADISKATGLSPTAAGGIVSSLIEKGYLCENGTGESKGGRRPVMLELKKNSRYSIGLDVDVDSVTFILMDIKGRVVFEWSSALVDNRPAAVASLAAEEIERVLSDCRIHKDKLLGIGISVPGMVDAETRRVVLAPNLSWEDADFGRMLREKIELPVYIENEAMASAICENWIGACKSVDNFICVNIKSGIGAGIFTGGRPYRGTGGSAGEVGHIVVDENGLACGCGNHGCLETIVSTGRIVEKAEKLIKKGLKSQLNEIENVSKVRLCNIVDAARSGNQAAGGLLEEAAGYLGIALSYLVNTLNPSKIVLGKDFVVYGDLVMDTLRRVVDRKALKRPAANVEIAVSEIGERSSTLGAAIIPLKILFGS